jgi:hypothetical protein
MGISLGGDESAGRRQRDLYQHRCPIWLRLALFGPHLANAGTRRIVYGFYDQGGDAYAAPAWEPARAATAIFDHVYQTFDSGTKRAVLRLYRNTRDTGM